MEGVSYYVLFSSESHHNDSYKAIPEFARYRMSRLQ